MVRRQVVRSPGVAQGRTAYEFGVPLGAFEGRAALPEGVYPFDAAVLAGGRAVWRGSGSVIVVAPGRRQPIYICIVWQLDEGLHVDPEGVFLDDVVPRSVSRAAGGQGSVAGHAAQLAAHKGIRASIALSPLLADQMRRLSKGSTRLRDGRKVQLGPGSPESGDARHALARYRRLLKLARIQPLAAPYAPAPLEELVGRRLGEDLTWQLTEGVAVLGDALGVEDGSTMIRTAPTTATVTALADRGVTNLVVSSAALVGGGRVPDRPLKLAAESRTRVLAYDPALSELLLSSTDPQGRMDELMRALAIRHLRGDGLVVLAPPIDRPQLEPDKLGRVYSTLERSGWIKTATVAQALKLVPPYSRAATLSAGKGRVGADSFWRALDKARNDYRAFETLTEEDNRLRRPLRRMLLVGEMARSRSTALAWQKALRAATAKEFSRVRLTAAPEVVLTSQRGKIALSLANGTDYVVRPTLVLSGQGVGFPDGRRHTLTLRPKETVYVTRVALVGATTRGKAVARLAADGRTLGRVVVAIRSTYIGRLTSVGAIIATLIGLLIYLWRRARRSEGPPAGSPGES